MWYVENWVRTLFLSILDVFIPTHSFHTLIEGFVIKPSVEAQEL